MKYIITESQNIRLYPEYIDHLKKPMFKYWDLNGTDNYRLGMKLFNIPPAGSSLVQEWLLEWMGGEDYLMKLLNEYTNVIMRGQAGSYDFKFIVRNPRVYTHGGVEIYFDVTIDGDGDVSINHLPGLEITNIYQALNNEEFGWEVEDELRDTVIETLDMSLPIPFDVYIDSVKVTEPGQSIRVESHLIYHPKYS